MIKDLCSKGFFKAPASTKYHCSRPGGLADHSNNVTDKLVELTEKLNLEWQRPESPYVIGLFHDLCKIDSYKLSTSEFNDDGSPVYEYNKSQLLQGHGERSVMLLSTYMRLTEEEVYCIRYHMGAYTTPDHWDEYRDAIKKYPNVLWTHVADEYAAKLVDR